MTAATARPEDVVTEFVEVTRCVPRDGNRSVGDTPKDELDALKQSMAGPAGLLHPIVVRPLRDGVGQPVKGFEIIAGERRWKAAKALGWTKIRATILPVDDTVAETAALIENLQRADLHPLDELTGYVKLIKQGATAETIAASTGQKLGYVVQRLALGRLEDAGRRLLAAGKLGVTQAWMIARLQPADQKEVLRYFWQGDVTVRGLQEWITRNVFRRLSEVPWSLTDAQLDTKAGPCALCPKRTGAAPMLFAEVGKEDCCTDGVCFQGKLAATIAAARASLGKAAFVQISTDTYSDEEAVLARGAWVPVSGKAPCASATKGLVVAGRSLKEIGKVLDVCVDRTCKIHREQRATVGGMSPTEKARQRNERKAVERSKRVHTAIFQAVIAKAAKAIVSHGGHLPASLGRLVTLRLLDRLDYDATKRLCKALGVEVTGKDEYGAHNEAIETMITKEKAPAPRMQIALALAPELYGHLTLDKESPLIQAAAALKVDVKAIEREIDRTAAAKAAPKKKAAPATGKKK